VDGGGLFDGFHQRENLVRAFFGNEDAVMAP
jgi:hypothetical protein